MTKPAMMVPLMLSSGFFMMTLLGSDKVRRFPDPASVVKRSRKTGCGYQFGMWVAAAMKKSMGIESMVLVLEARKAWRGRFPQRDGSWRL